MTINRANIVKADGLKQGAGRVGDHGLHLFFGAANKVHRGRHRLQHALAAFT